MDLLGAVMTIGALLGIALLILLFERKRARQIEHDLRRDVEERRRRDGGPPT